MTMRLLLGSAAIALMANAAFSETVLNRGNDTDPATLDHHRTSTVSEGNVLLDLYEGLVAKNPAGEAIPGVAESWTISDDGLVYTFKLRGDAKWSNGDPVTANDFDFTFHRIMNPKTAAGYASILYGIKNAEEVNSGKLPLEELGVKALDAQTLEITLHSPAPYFIELLTHQTGLPMHQASVEQHGDKFTTPGTMVTNGAYKLVAFMPNDKITMAKNEFFHDAANVAIDTLNWIPFEDRATCMRRFEAGEVQICSDVPGEQMTYAREKFGDELRIAPYLGVYYLPVKGKEGSPLKDPRVRQAMSMVIDRDFLAKEVWQETMLPGYSLVPPGIVNYTENPPVLPYKDDDILDREDAAKQLLADAGVAEGSLSVELLYNTGENNKNTMAAVADALSNIGIRAELNETEGASYFSYLREDGPYDLARAGWIGDYNDPQNFLFIFGTGVSFNYAKWANPEFDALLKKAEQITDLDERANVLAEAETIFLEEVPAIPILYYSSRSLVSSKVQGYEDNLADDHPTRWLSLSE